MTITAVAALGFAAVFAGVAGNNLFATHSRQKFEEDLNQSYLKAVEWTIAQGGESNYHLVYMLKDCAEISSDRRLMQYARRAFAQSPNRYFARLMDPSAPFVLPPARYLRTLAPYKTWMLHAIARGEFDLTDADKADMFAPHGYRTGRATHQLFALMLYRKYNGTSPSLNALIRRVSERIAKEASLDFRVTDLYVQRIAFLLAAGQPDLVKPRWVERTLASQQPSGKWLYSWHHWQPSPFQLDFTEDESNHTTAQGLWLACMVKYRYPEWIAKNFQ